MLDVTPESAITLADACKLFPGNPNLSTVYRWAFKGVRGIRLETVAIGMKRFTSRDAIQYFIERTTKAADAALAGIPVDQVQQKRRPRAQAVAAAEKLAKGGF